MRRENPNVSTVIMGASRPEQLKENFKALEIADKIDNDIMQQIEDIFKNQPKLPYDWLTLWINQFFIINPTFY